MIFYTSNKKKKVYKEWLELANQMKEIVQLYAKAKSTQLYNRRIEL